MLNALYALPLEQFKQRIRQKLRAFVQDTFLYMRPDLRFDDKSLFTTGVIDSLGVRNTP